MQVDSAMGSMATAETCEPVLAPDCSEMIRSTIREFKQQIQAILQLKFVPANQLATTMTAVRHSYTCWISNQLRRLADESEEPEDSMTTTELIDSIWINFHHPVIKYYQAQLALMAGGKPGTSNSPRGPVEKRKMGDLYVKFLKDCAVFYQELLQDIATEYPVDQVNRVTQRFFVSKPGKRSKSRAKYQNLIQGVQSRSYSSIFESRVIYLCYKIFIALGDCSRYRARHENVAGGSIPTPGVFRHASSMYQYAIDTCPSLGDAYNSLGMIAVLEGQSVRALYCFVRGCCVKYSNDLVVTNLQNVLKKKESMHLAIDSYRRMSLSYQLSQDISRVPEHLGNLFIGLLGYHLVGGPWRKGNDGFCIESLRYSEVETKFLKGFGDYVMNSQQSITVLGQMILHMVVVIIGSLASQKKLMMEGVSNSTNFSGFAVRFVTELLSSVHSGIGAELKAGRSTSDAFRSLLAALPALRTCFAWLLEEKDEPVYRKFKKYRRFLKSCALIVNDITGYLKSQNEGALLPEKPKRSQVFPEDAELAEFAPIGFIFEDFDDSQIAVGMDSSRSDGTGTGRREEKTIPIKEMSLLRCRAVLFSAVSLLQAMDENYVWKLEAARVVAASPSQNTDFELGVADSYDTHNEFQRYDRGTPVRDRQTGKSKGTATKAREARDKSTPKKPAKKQKQKQKQKEKQKEREKEKMQSQATGSTEETDVRSKFKASKQETGKENLHKCSTQRQDGITVVYNAWNSGDVSSNPELSSQDAVNNNQGQSFHLDSSEIAEPSSASEDLSKYEDMVDSLLVDELTAPAPQNTGLSGGFFDLRKNSVWSVGQSSLYSPSLSSGSVAGSGVFSDYSGFQKPFGNSVWAVPQGSLFTSSSDQDKSQDQTPSVNHVSASLSTFEFGESTDEIEINESAIVDFLK